MPTCLDRFAHRLIVPLDPDYAARLARLAKLAGVPEATLAVRLLSNAIEDADPDACSTAAILDGILGAYEHAIQSLERACRRADRAR